MSDNQTRCGTAAILGMANVGKSSLLNRLIGEKAAIVTPKPQTTRTRVTGILTENSVQTVFFDTPGFHSPKTRLSNRLNKDVAISARGVDLLLFVKDSLKPVTETEKKLLEKTAENPAAKFLVFNKTDLVKNKISLPLTAEKILKLCPFDEVFFVSAKTGDGTDELRAEILNRMAPGEFLFPDEYYSADTQRFIVSEIIREKLLLLLHDEIPHGVAVRIEKFQQRSDVITEISADIYCEKQSHKGIIIGAEGALLKKVGTFAREDIEKMLGTKVALKLWVKVKENWREKEGAISELLTSPETGF